MRDLYDDDDAMCAADGSPVVPNGGKVHVPMMVQDAARDHQPHFASDAASKSANFADLDTLRDAARRERSRWIGRMCDAWRAPPAGVVAGPGQQRQTNLEQHNRSALSIEPDNGSQPDTGSRPWEIAAHERPDHDLNATMARHQQQRDRAYENYKTGLGERWRRPLSSGKLTPPHRGARDPKRAEELEAERERWLGK
jgi:hypothetical protein